jgi:integrase/recombinase XerD
MAKVRRRPPKPLTVPTVEDPNSLFAWANRYLTWTMVQNYSPRSEATRRCCLGQFVTWCEARSLYRPEEITKPIIERYQKHLFHYRQPVSGKPLSFPTQLGKLVVIRMFFKWLTRQNVILYNPAAELELPRVSKRLPRHVFSPEEVERVLNQPEAREPMGIRDRAILETFYSTGMRRLELVDLMLYDLELDARTMLIRHGKGDKQRIVPVGERAIAWVRKYLDEVRPLLALEPDDRRLFLGEDGEPLRLHHVTQLCKKYIAASGIGKPGATHAFRHACATAMLEGGADIRFIQQLLGHSELGSSQIYTHVSVSQLQLVHDVTHPTAKLRRKGVTDSEATVPGVHTAVASAFRERSALKLQEALAEEAAEEEIDGN